MTGDGRVSRRRLLRGAGVSVPGPVLRAAEGDRVLIRFENRTDHAHNVHLHGRHAPRMDGWEPMSPGGSFAYDVTAEPFGLHPYHCHTAPLAEHVARGLYGAMIIDPPGVRLPAHEFAPPERGRYMFHPHQHHLAERGAMGWFAAV